MRRPLVAALAALAGAASMTSCGMLGRADDEDTAKIAKVVVLVPQGTASGDGVAAALRLGLDESTDEISGWTVEVEVVDDQSEDVTLDERASEIVDDDAVAVVGGLSTETVRAVQPVFDAASLLFASPADTAREHTRGADPDAPLRPYESYFQTSVGDDDPLEELARHVVDSLDVSTVAVIDAGGEHEADAFAGAFRDAEGEVLRVDERDAQQNDDAADDDAADDDAADDDAADDDAADGDGTQDGPARQREVTVDDVGAMIDEARSNEAGAVFVSGAADVAAAVSDEIARRGVDMQLLGGSVLMSDAFMAEAGSSAEGALTAVESELSAQGGSGQDDGFAARMADAGADPGPYGAAAYDTGVALGTVLERCLPSAPSASGAREGCVGEFAEVRFEGVTGEFAFDDYGGRVGAAPAIMRIRDGAWARVEGP
ncbi:hypothetical protein [Phytoactinopolyspora halotolerans]|uniref:ABC transporter substrate-binding protein n=1 Tax=Phytoactinopolyspora halotolerans TaxID=1981512 RepID=A0A6L9SAU5_9ACTN|nr:hypothetical protein [Phytoactinopolyspora halotolerans]NEE02219.1 hypothetical protein [Phytoactinopolyspora halotolerans]